MRLMEVGLRALVSMEQGPKFSILTLEQGKNFRMFFIMEQGPNFRSKIQAESWKWVYKMQHIATGLGYLEKSLAANTRHPRIQVTPWGHNSFLQNFCKI